MQRKQPLVKLKKHKQPYRLPKKKVVAVMVEAIRRRKEVTIRRMTIKMTRRRIRMTTKTTRKMTKKMTKKTIRKTIRKRMIRRSEFSTYQRFNSLN